MKIKEIMTKNMVMSYPNTTLKDASNMMKSYDIGFLPVQKENEFIGVITDRDIVVRAIANEKDIHEKIENYMTNYIITVSSNASLEDALEIMASEQIKRLMVEENDKIVGIVSLSDILDKVDDNSILEHVVAIFKPFDDIVITNEIDIPQAEVDEFEL